MTQSTINRRKFLQLSSIGGAAAMLPLSATAAMPEYQRSKIEYRSLGKTGLKVSSFSLGPIRANSAAMIKAAYRAGVNHFDSAYVYGEGLTDRTIGGLIKSGEIPRDKVILSTKIKMNKVPDEQYEKIFRERFEESLGRLNTDYVEILYYHQADDEATVRDPRMQKILLKLKEEGKTKHIGISIHGYEPDMLQAVIDEKVYEVVMVYYNYKQKDSDKIKEKIEACTKAGIGVVAMKVMAGAKGVDGPTALKWVLQNKNISTAVMGCGTFDQFEADLAAALKPKLTKQEKEKLIITDDRQSLYCQQCQQCKGQCPAGLPIPDLMRGYMYLYGYHDLQEAQTLLSDLGSDGSACESCEACKVKCTAGFAVGEKIKDYARLSAVPTEFLAKM